MPVKYKLKKANGSNEGHTIRKAPSEMSDSATDLYNKMELISAVQNGMEVEKAAKAIGISKYKLGQYQSDPDFDEVLQSAFAECELTNLKNVNIAGNCGDWRASAWVLEKIDPSRYGKKETIIHEYEVKLSLLKKIIVDVVNDVDPLLRRRVLQRLNTIDVNKVAEEAAEIEYQENTSINMSSIQ